MATIEETLKGAEENLRRLRDASHSEPEDGKTDDNERSGDSSSEGKVDGIQAVVADKGYHKAALLRRLKENVYRTYISERRQKGRRRWTDKGGQKTADAFYGNRARVQRKKGRGLQRKRSELNERTFAHICETGGGRDEHGCAGATTSTNDTCCSQPQRTLAWSCGVCSVGVLRGAWRGLYKPSHEPFLATWHIGGTLPAFFGGFS